MRAQSAATWHLRPVCLLASAVVTGISDAPDRPAGVVGWMISNAAGNPQVLYFVAQRGELHAELRRRTAGPAPWQALER